MKLRRSALPPSLQLFAATAFTLTLAIWGFTALAVSRHWGFPYNWPLFPRGNKLFDLHDYFERFADLHTVHFFTHRGYPFTYFAPGVPLYRFFYLFGLHGSTLVYTALGALIALASFVLLSRALIQRNMRPWSAVAFSAITVATSYPFLFCVERGNLELFLAAGVGIGIWAFWTDKPLLAAILWGVFGSVKLYPLLLVALFFSQKRYRYAALTVLVAVGTTLLSLWYIGPTMQFAYRGIHAGTQAFLAWATFTFDGQSWDHSLFASLKVFASHAMPRLLALYLPIAGAAMLALYVWRVRKLPLLNQLIFLSIAEVILPPTSYDYTLVELYPAFIAFTFALLARRFRGSTPLALLFAFLFTPFSFVAYRGYSLNGTEKLFALGAALLVSVAVPLVGESQLVPVAVGAADAGAAVERTRDRTLGAA